jgi:hypothetical protein
VTTPDDDGAAFTIDEHTEVACFWFAERPQHSNVIALLMRQAGGLWHARVRLRLYLDARVFDSADRKHVYTLTPQDPGKSVTEHLADIDGIMTELFHDLGFTTTDRVELHTVGFGPFWERMRGKHYMQRGTPQDTTRKAGM